MANKNSILRNAKKQKRDEFYTQLTDIEKEMKHFRHFFRDKVVYCNCDDPRESNFFKYFSMNFEFLGLKKLITTGYKENGRGVVFVYEGDKNGNHVVDDEEIKVTELQGDGDFRSDECIKFLKEADVVVTNPPFSLFREHLGQLMEYGKKFLIIGNQNAITYKEIFPLIKNNQLWLGYGFAGGAAHFINTSYQDYATSTNHKDGMIRVSGVVWFINIDNIKRNTPLDMYMKYYPEVFPKYDNYDAINVNKTCDIPMDYEGVMGVPITFLDKYCPEQFEILGIMSGAKGGCLINGNDGRPKFYVDGKGVYARILIRHKHETIK